MTERLRIVESIGQLPAVAWHQLMEGHPALRLEMLSAIASAATSPQPLRIFLLEDAQGLAAAAVCRPVTASGETSSLDALLFGRAARAARRLGIVTRPVLLFRTPLGTESALVVRPVAAPERRRILQRLLDDIHDHADRQHMGIAFLGVFDDPLLEAALHERGYLHTEIQPTTRMDICWSDFDGYVAHIQRSSRGAAKTVRRERNRSRSANVTISQVSGDLAGVEALSVLSRAHYRGKNGVDPHWSPRLLPAMLQELGADLLVFEAVRAGRRVGMVGVVRSGAVGWVAFFGVDPLERGNDFVYANLCYYHLAERAASLGLTTLLYGTHALQAKRLRGCRVLTSNLFYRPSRSLLRLAGKAFFLIHRAWYRRKFR